jgi:hypothetical protein
MNKGSRPLMTSGRVPMTKTEGSNGHFPPEVLVTMVMHQIGN